MLNGQIDEFLVVGVAAGHAGFWGDIDDAGVLVKPGEHIACA